MDTGMEAVRKKYGDEAVEKLEKLLKSSGSMPPPQQLSIDGPTVLVILAACALLVGKTPEEVNVSQTARVAFSLSNRLFNPTGELDE